MSGDDKALAASLLNITQELAGVRADVRKIIIVEQEVKTLGQSSERGWLEMKRISDRVDRVDDRVRLIEAMLPLQKLVRGAVFAVIALAMMMAFTMLFQGVIRPANDFRPPAAPTHQSAP